MPNFFEFGSSISEKILKFEGFLTIYGHGGHLGHVMLHIKFDEFFDDLEFYHEDQTIN